MLIKLDSKGKGGNHLFTQVLMSAALAGRRRNRQSKKRTWEKQRERGKEGKT